MKKIASVFVSLVLMCSLLFIPSFEAKAESITVKGIPSSAKIGDTISFTVSIPSNIGGFVYVSYDKNVLEYVSGPQDSSNGLIKYTAFFESSAQTIKFKVKASGETSIKVYMEEAEYSDTIDKLPSLPAVTKTIVVENETANTELSSDNYLAKLNITAGTKKVTLSPTFNYRKTSYTATVAYDVTDVVVSVTRSSGKAEIVSITDNGKVKLNVGANKVEIVVKAENGKTRTYTVTITRKEKAQENPVDPPATQEPPTPATPDFEYGGASYYVAEAPADKIPAGFVEKTVLLSGGKEVEGLSFEKADLTVLYLENDSKVGNFFIYNEKEKMVYPLIKLSAGESYVIALMAADEDVPENYNACTLSVKGEGVVNAYQIKDAESLNMSDFYLMYCVNNAGVSGWYQYDLAEGTYQRYTGMIPADNTQNGTEGTEDGENTEVVAPNDSDLQNKYNELEKELQSAKDMQRLILCVAIFLGAVFVIIIINLLVFRNQKGDEYEEDDDENDDYEEDEEEVSKTPEEEKKDKDEVEFIDL